MDFGHFWETYFSTMFWIIFWTRRQKAVRQGFDPDIFMTELPCHQLGAKLRRFILTFRPGSTYQHQKNKFSCRCGERDLFLSPVPPVLPLIIFFRKNTIPGKKRPSQRVILRSFLTIFVQVSKCHFLGGEGGDDDVATTLRRRDKSEITWPLPHRTQGPNTS